MSVVPDSAGVGTVTRASPGVSFDVFDSNTAESPESSVSAGGVGHEGFGTPLLPVAAGKVATAGLKDAGSVTTTDFGSRETEVIP